MIKIVYHGNARNISAERYDPVRRNKQVSSDFFQNTGQKTLVPDVPQQRVNGAERDGDIFDVAANDRELVIPFVTDKYKMMLRMGTDKSPGDLQGEPPYAVVRDRF
jgi:hypothetical protein